MYYKFLMKLKLHCIFTFRKIKKKIACDLYMKYLKFIFSINYLNSPKKKF